MAIGLTLIAAFLVVLQRTRVDMAASESLASLQDAARHALAVLGDDLEHAGFFGFARGRAQLVRGGVVVAEDTALLQPGAGPPVSAAAGLPAGAHDCGINFAVDLLRVVQAADNHFAMGEAPIDCAPTATAGGAATRADTLTVRHASLETAAPRAGRLQLYARRLASHEHLDLFADGRAPGPVAEDAVLRDLEVRTWYVANDSVDRPGWPALRVKSLTESRGAAQFRDEEVMPGVEDLQVQFAVTDPADASRVRFVPPGIAGARDAQVVAVRVWLRVRADVTQDGFQDARPL